MANTRVYSCGRCGMSFTNYHQLGPHVRVCSAKDNVIRFGEFDDTFENDASGFDASSDTEQAQLLTATPHTQNVNLQTPQLHSGTPQTPTPPVPTPPVPTAISDLCARTGCGPGAVVEDAPLSRSPNIVPPNSLLTRNYCPLQRAWHGHVQSVYHMCDPDFWKMFEAVLLQSTTCVDHVLSTCLDMFKKKGVSVNKC